MKIVCQFFYYAWFVLMILRSEWFYHFFYFLFETLKIWLMKKYECVVIFSCQLIFALYRIAKCNIQNHFESWLFFLRVKKVVKRIRLSFDSDRVIRILTNLFETDQLEHKFDILIILDNFIQRVNIGPMRQKSWCEVLLTDMFIRIQWFWAEEDVVADNIVGS